MITQFTVVASDAPSLDDALEAWWDMSMEITGGATDLLGKPHGWSGGSGDEEKAWAKAIMDAAQPVGSVVYMKAGDSFTIPVMATSTDEHIALGFADSVGSKFHYRIEGAIGVRVPKGANEYIITGVYEVTSMSPDQADLKFLHRA